MSAKTPRDAGRLHTAADYPGKIYPALLHNPERTDGAKVLYAHMHWRYGRNAQNFESQTSMARHLGVSERTIANRLLELEHDDWIVVEIQERSEKSGNFTTPFYHIFERQDDCRRFRAVYVPEGRNIIRSKPAAEDVPTRKSRKGKGGLVDEKNRHRLNKDSSGGLNSDSDRGVNSDSTRALNKDSDKQPPIEHAVKTAPAAEQPKTAADALRAYEIRIGPYTGQIMEHIKDWCDDVPAEWLIEAFELCVEYNKRSWRYAEAIIRRWHEQGKDSGRLDKKPAASTPRRGMSPPVEEEDVKPMTPEQFRALKAQMKDASHD